MNYTPKIEFGKSVDSLTAHSFLSFLYLNLKRDANYVFDYFDLKSVNWNKLIENSIRECKPLEEPGKPVTEYGVSLL